MVVPRRSESCAALRREVCRATSGRLDGALRACRSTVPVACAVTPRSGLRCTYGGSCGDDTDPPAVAPISRAIAAAAASPRSMADVAERCAMMCVVAVSVNVMKFAIDAPIWCASLSPNSAVIRIVLSAAAVPRAHVSSSKIARRARGSARRTAISPLSQTTSTVRSSDPHPTRRPRRAFEFGIISFSVSHR